MLLRIFGLLSVCTLFSQSAKILGVFPVPSVSHQVVFRAITNELARRGHELVIIATDPAYPKGGAPINVTEIDMHDESYKMWQEHFVANNQGISDNMDTVEIFLTTVIKIFEMQINTKEIQNLIKNESGFDLILTEGMARIALVMSHVFKAPVIQINSLGALPPMYQVMGAPYHPIYYPEVTRLRTYNLTTLEKIEGLYQDIRFRYLQHRLEKIENEVIKRNFGSEAPTIFELTNNVQMLLLNIHPFWDGNRPVPPGVIFMGGIQIAPVKDLPSKLKEFMDNSKNGVIYMSFGTNYDPTLLPYERLQLLIKVFGKLPYDVIFKYNGEDIPGKPENVRLEKWVPQPDLLRHPKLKLFITQAGLQSTDEAIHAGVPLLAFPIYGDQRFNAEKYVHYKIGMMHDIKTINEETLETSIKLLIEDKSYQKNMAKLRDVMHDQPQRPLDRAIWWIEHVIRHGDSSHLRCAAFNVSWSEYLMLDVVIALIGATMITTLVVTIFFMKCVRLFSKNDKIKKQ